MITIDFTKTKGQLTLQDALWLEDDHSFTEVEIEAMKQEAFDRWLLAVAKPYHQPDEEV